MEALLFVNMGEDAQHARSLEAIQFVNMGDNALNARSVEALLFVNMGEDALNARSVEALLFVNFENSKVLPYLCSPQGRCPEAVVFRDTVLPRRRR